MPHHTWTRHQHHGLIVDAYTDFKQLRRLRRFYTQQAPRWLRRELRQRAQTIRWFESFTVATEAHR